jgi:hypothetical protein
LRNGIDIGANQTALLKKIEELTLFAIEQNKQIEEQNKQIKKLQEIVLRQNEIVSELKKKLE